MSEPAMKINSSRIEESIDLLKQYLNEDDIAPLLPVLEEMVSNPHDETLLTRLYDAFNTLGFVSASVLTYAPYLAVILSAEPFKDSDD
jgi:hypothetical protein